MELCTNNEIYGYLKEKIKMKLLEIFEISESYRLPDTIMDALFSNNAEKIIKEVKDNVSEDIREIFQLEQGR